MTKVKETKSRLRGHVKEMGKAIVNLRRMPARNKRLLSSIKGTIMTIQPLIRDYS